MPSKLHLLGAIAAASLFATPAMALEPCANTTFSALAATSCLGAFSGNINGSQSELDDLSVWGSFSYVGKSDDASNGPFTSNPNVAVNGTLTFDTALTGMFVIGLKASNEHSYYLFNALAPVSSLTFDSTAGVAVNGRVPQDLSHANLYAITAPIPEPETYALLLAGLGLVGFMSKRRKPA
ncbi:MAG TPA: PEP-CTERM sorting domain-containing protein [Caldimonas sp.]|jgi:hypothetical protein|nr:PEP-CTERM sorting domain-containing protein [Caldimonas sp.]HEX2539905.1 PEP-CTERM sorting domain-containing protein [Caldimonas sp.]